MDKLWFILPLLIFGWLAWFSWRYAWWRPSVDLNHPRILMYHMVCDHIPNAQFNGMRVPPAQFESQIKWLKDNGWSFYTVAELLEQRDQLPPKSVSITFDDGYADNAVQALPILKKYGGKGTVFLVVDRHQAEWSTHKKKKHNSGELKTEPKLTDVQVMELLDSGCFELASHTMTHPNFAALDEDAKFKELAQSKNMLEARFGVEIKTFAYPFGILKDSDPDLVRKAGYVGAVTTCAGISPKETLDPYMLKRIKISGKENLLAFKTRIRTGRRGANK
ncbi:MAG: polysaccharide deacetylase family protein [Verrucomicrobia bacterium]|jgi:peptidoglycan/xylan/chitin deacetylase (PgdA/CDA1 family)|nr:polysaccharide deacetylase family protein [Verrucomicrobiota bacterium]